MARCFPIQQTPPSSLENPKTEIVPPVSEIRWSDPQTQAAADAHYKVSKYPPGYRFVPEDEELIFHYLKPFVHGDPLPEVDIHHVNIYKYNPKELADKFTEGNDKKEWFFLTERTKKYEGGKKPDCCAKGGYWKATGGETKITAGKGVLGSRRSLEYRTGKQPNGVKTGWIMQEYGLDNPLPPSSSNKKSHSDSKMLDTVLCKIYMSPMEKMRIAQEEEEEENEEGDVATREALNIKLNEKTREDLNIKPKEKTREDLKIKPNKNTREVRLPRPSSFDELSWIFYTPQQKTSTV